jgi:hypothetical protein
MRMPAARSKREATAASTEAAMGGEWPWAERPTSSRAWPALRSALAALCAAAPIAAYLAYVSRYGVNVLSWDEWDIVPLIHSLRSGTLTLAQLWSPHNEHRMLVPNLIFLLVAQIARFDTTVLMYLSACLLIISYVLLVLLYRKRQHSLLGVVPVAYLLFSLAQSENILWGFQLAWYIVLACLFGVMYCLEQPANNRLAFASGIIVAVVGSCSSFPGLFVWPVGLIYLMGGKFTLRQRLIWMGFGLLTVLVYFAGSGIGATGGSLLSRLVSHPFQSGKYFFVAVGSVIPMGRAGQFVQGLFGLVLCAFGVYVAIAGGIRARSDRAFLAPIALVAFALIFDVMLAVGRSISGVAQAESSRYTAYNLLLMVGVYLALLRLLTARDEHDAVIPALAGAFALLMFIQISVSSWAGLAAGKGTLHSRIQAADLVVNYRTAPASLIIHYLNPIPENFRAWAAILEQDRLSVFATPNAAVYAQVGIVPGGRIGSVVPIPQPLAAPLQRDASLSRAWRVLSALYFLRPDLQQAFPQTSADYIANLLSWATTSGVTADSDSAFLIPYTEQLRYLRAVITGSAR